MCLPGPLQAADIAMEAAAARGLAPVRFWATNGPKYALEEKAVSTCGSVERPSEEVLRLLAEIRARETPDLRAGSPYFHV